MGHDERDFRHGALTRKIIGCCMEVHNYLGSGFPEIIYQRALAVELQCQELNFLREEEMSVYYKGVHVGIRRVDFFIEDKVLLEIKAMTELTDAHLAQALNYLEAFGMETGLLINFGARSLEFKRILNRKFKSP